VSILDKKEKFKTSLFYFNIFPYICIMFNKDIAESYINKLLNHYKIKVVSWSKTDCGRAWVSSKEVKIPKPTNLMRFCIALHEIGHIVEDATKSKMKLYQSEYKAEQFAIREAKSLGFDTTEYEKNARGYVTMCIAKGHARKLNLDKIEPNIKDFCGIDFETWKGKKVFVSNWRKELNIEIKN